MAPKRSSGDRSEGRGRRPCLKQRGHRARQEAGCGAAKPSGMAPSRILSRRGTDKFRHLLAVQGNMGGATSVLPALTAPAGLTATHIPVFVHSLYAGLVPTFSSFFDAILEYYQIHLLHLHPNSIMILYIFTFLCEAYVGVQPSV